ncbi:unnamed protein product [Phaedon cochleariae]|uniref:Saccharopine dehydrogenase NADP binding domain-containing protein n=1 Tax=Phaedon cochleariae TaxID=80249 RepID=A0A9N9SML1_PHACE|nr:unnamed protein product [Phaedon cochleariae]
MEKDRFDIVLFGATGFTGKYCIPYIVKLSKVKSFSWAIAGRSEEKLMEVLKKIGAEMGSDLSSISTIVADIGNDVSLFNMARRAKVLINCCGPFRTLGRPVVNACLRAGTHQVDVNGDPEYMETIELEENENAKRKGVYILSACGLDSIPSDMGIAFLQENFGGTVNSAVTYMETWEEGTKTPGSAVNYTTWVSAITAFANKERLVELRRRLYPKEMPMLRPRLKRKILPHKSDLVNGWVLPFPGSDHSVVERSQRYFYEKEFKRPVQVDTLCVAESFFYVILLAILGIMFTIFSAFEWGRKFMIDHPELFSNGVFSKNEPSREKIEKTWFAVTVQGKGWKHTPSNKDLVLATPCNQSMVVRVKGRNPCYGATAACLVCAAVTVLTQSGKMPGRGGVYPPAAAFAKTSLIELLNENDVTFEIISNKQI